MNVWEALGIFAKIAAALGSVCVAAALFGSPDEPKTALVVGIFFLLTSGIAFIFSRKTKTT